MGTYFFETIVDVVGLRLGAAWQLFVAFIDRLMRFAFLCDPPRIEPEHHAPALVMGRDETRAFVARRLARDQRRLGAACIYAAA